jgi:hypothetical protein
MSIVNTVFTIIGVLVTLIGILTFFFPGLARIINAPGGPKFKALIALIAGLVFLIIGLLVEIPVK